MVLSTSKVLEPSIYEVLVYYGSSDRTYNGPHLVPCTHSRQVRVLITSSWEAEAAAGVRSAQLWGEELRARCQFPANE